MEKKEVHCIKRPGDAYKKKYKRSVGAWVGFLLRCFYRQSGLAYLFKIWCKIFPPQLGMLHVFAGPELPPSAKYDSFQTGSFNALLEPEVPNVGWAMVYGDEFAQEVDVRRIVEAGFAIENIGNGYLVRVTDSINDVVDDFWQFSRRRAELKKLFRDGFFLTEDEPPHDRNRSSA